MPKDPNAIALARWRLVLGRFAERRMPGALEAEDDYSRMDRMLDYLYGRKSHRRGSRTDGTPIRDGGDLGPSLLTVPEWIREVRELFPSDACEVITRHALHRFGMAELVTDREVLATLQPNYDLLRAILTFKGTMKEDVLELARRIVHKVVDDIRRKLESELRPVLWGRKDAHRRTRFRTARNLDMRRTVRLNLKHWDAERQKLLVRDLFFRARTQRTLPWHIIMAVDCSGSMIDSVIHSAIMAAIFKGLPSVRVKLLAFDTQVVDLSDVASDPVETLMSVQLGGGTNIAEALRTSACLVVHPTRTIVVLVTDFHEAGSSAFMLSEILRLRSEGVRVLGLAALDRNAKPSYNRQVAEACADAGAEVAAMTPQHLAEWLWRVLA